MTSIRNFMTDESGATMVEYGLMVALIAAVLVFVVKAIGAELLSAFEDVNTAIANR